MPYMVFGLPTHILLIHAAVVGIPTSCLAVIAIAARPAWRKRFGFKVAVFAVVMVPVTYATELAGEQLFNHNSGLQGLSEVQHHKELGLKMVWFMIAVAVLAILLVLADRGGYSDNHAIMVVLASLSIAASAVCIYWVILVGDSGARAVWGFLGQG